MGTREYEFSRRGRPDKTEQERREELKMLCLVSAPFGHQGGRIVCLQPLPCKYHDKAGRK